MSDVSSPCRLCGGGTTWKFSKLVLGKHQVAFHECSRCGALQSDSPYWLAEAYENGNLGALDTGAAERVLNMQALTTIIARLLGASRILDVGGGDGLLCRLMRDLGFDAYVFDKYSRLTYGQGFESQPRAQFDLITAFEVFEHLPEPHRDLGTFFQSRPPAVLGTTELYKGHGPDWWYLVPEAGQHVFFYSKRALFWIAEEFGYHLIKGRGFFLFTEKPLDSLRRLVVKKLIRDRTIRVERAIIALSSKPGVDADFQMATKCAASIHRRTEK